MRTAKKSMRVSDLAWEMDEERTVERRVRVQEAQTSIFATRLTKRMEKIDSLLIAIARGDIEPDGTRARPAAPLPASSTYRKVATATEDELIEVQDELIEVEEELVEPQAELIEVQDELIEVDEDWLTSDVEPEPFSK